jgi:hypothetical protein
MVIVHNPIQNKWFNNLNYLSKQIYVGVIWKSDVNMPLDLKMGVEAVW